MSELGSSKTHHTDRGLSTQFRDWIHHLDFETFGIIAIMLLIVKNAPLVNLGVAAWLVSICLVLAWILAIGWKFACFSIRLLKVNERSNLELPLTIFLGFGFIYFVWIALASFSSSAPVLSGVIALAATLAPPRYGIIRKMRKWVGMFKQEREIIKSDGLVTMQFALMALSLFAFTQVDTTRWIVSIFEQIPEWIFIVFFALIIITFYLALRGSHIWLLSLMLVFIWSRSFMLAAGYLRFGGDDGESMAIVKYLLDGAAVPFVDVNPEPWNWRFGSFASLFFHSNMAFISSITGIDPSMGGGVLAIGLSGVCFPLATYSFTRSVLSRIIDVRISAVAITMLIGPEFWWQFRFDANNMMHIFILPLIAVFILVPRNRKGFLLLCASALIIVLCHPSALAIALPSLGVFLWEYYRRPGLREIITNRYPWILIIIGAVAVAILSYFPDLAYTILRALSLSDLIGPYARISWDFGFYITASSIFVQFFSKYVIIIGCMILGIVSFGIVRRSGLYRYDGRIKSFLRLWIPFFALVLFLDFFIRIAAIPAWRFWPLIFGTTLVITVPYLLLIFEAIGKKLLRGTKAFKARGVVLLLLSALITPSLILFSYPTDQALNLDTTTVDEYYFLQRFLNSVDVNKSIIISEMTTWRLILGILGDWPPATPTYFDRNESYPAIYSNTYGQERIVAFSSLAYYGRSEGIRNLLSEIGVEDVYVVVLYRYSGNKSVSWYGGSPYVDNLEGWRNLYLQDKAGYVIRFSRTDYQSLDISLDVESWNTSQFGITNITLENANSSLLMSAFFSSHYMSLRLETSFSPITMALPMSLNIGYTGDGHEGAPLIRLFIGTNETNTIELTPALESESSSVTLEFSLQELPYSNISYIRLQFDSLSDSVEWPGPGLFTYLIHEVRVSWWES